MALIPHRLRQTLHFPPRDWQVHLVLGNDHHAAAGMGRVRPGKADQYLGGKDPRLPFDFPNQRQQRLHRLNVGGRYLTGQEQWHTNESRPRAMAAANRAREQSHRPLQRLRGVAVGGRAVDRPDVGLVGELFGEIAMQIQSGGDGNTVSDHSSDRAYQIGLPAPNVFDQQRTVQDQTDSVQLACLLNPGHDLISQPEVGALCHNAGWGQPTRVQNGYGFDAQILHHVAKRGIGRSFPARRIGRKLAIRLQEFLTAPDLKLLQ